MTHAMKCDGSAAPQGGSSRGRMLSGEPNPIDVHVGSRVRTRRKLMNLSQVKFAERLGLTFQQIQKYERGTNRIGASRLWDIAKVLSCPVSYFFEDIGDAAASASPRNLFLDIPDLTKEIDHMDAERSQLIQDYYKIKDARVRRRVYELAKSLAMQGPEPGG